MNRDRALELKKFAQTVADRFSNFNRDGNQNKETFTVHDIIPLSDDSAVINFKKTSKLKTSGKLAVAFCYYINRGRSKGWKYFFPTDSHVSGMQAFHFYKSQAERINYSKN